MANSGLDAPWKTDVLKANSQFLSLPSLPHFPPLFRGAGHQATPSRMEEGISRRKRRNRGRVSSFQSNPMGEADAPWGSAWWPPGVAWAARGSPSCWSWRGKWAPAGSARAPPASAATAARSGGPPTAAEPPRGACPCRRCSGRCSTCGTNQPSRLTVVDVARFTLRGQLRSIPSLWKQQAVNSTRIVRAWVSECELVGEWMWVSELSEFGWMNQEKFADGTLSQALVPHLGGVWPFGDASVTPLLSLSRSHSFTLPFKSVAAFPTQFPNSLINLNSIYRPTQLNYYFNHSAQSLIHPLNSIIHPLNSVSH